MTTPQKNTQKMDIPEYLDEPERILFWTMDEALALLVPVALGIQTAHPTLGLFCGFGLMLLLKRLKGTDRHDFLPCVLYWYFPRQLTRLKVMPPSYCRRFIG